MIAPHLGQTFSKVNLTLQMKVENTQTILHCHPLDKVNTPRGVVDEFKLYWINSG